MSKNWYPVINAETCIECGKCVNFCSHNVYDKNSPQKPEVVYPDGCVDHCHGCGGLCPTGSITYVGEDTGWTPPNTKADTGCGCGSDCSCGCDTAGAEPSAKNLTVDFLYLDLNTCERCIATGDTLDEALAALAPAFDTLNYAVNVNKVNINTKELAEQYRFVSSPTIRVNGVDICTELKESDCADCGTLSGCSTYCRVFVYEGNDYEQPPTAMIIDGILRVLYGEPAQTEQKPYVMPENLINYFKGRESKMKNMSIYEPAMCCPTGLCGVSIDPELLRISTVLDTLKKNGVEVSRYNLTSFPQEFVKNAKVNERLMDEGVEVLPIIVVDGKVVITKRYPKNDEFVKLLDLPSGVLGASDLAKADEASSCCCGDDEPAKTDEPSSCCGGSKKSRCC